MNILIDINHPAHVHYYRNLCAELEHKGHHVIWTAREQESVIRLLTLYDIPFIRLPGKPDGRLKKILRQIQLDWKVYRLCKREHIDFGIGTSVTVAHVSKLSSMRSIVFDDDDDEVQPLMTRYVHPAATCILSPDVLTGQRKRRDTVYYPGYHELAYLHPKRFTPDLSVLTETGLKEGEPFFIMRFNAFKAHHDVGISGITLEQKRELIKLLEPYGRILITSENEIESEFDQYKLKIRPDKAHSLMAFASIFLGDSQTMTSEAAMLGVPSVRCNSFAGRISYLEEQEKKYGLTFAYQPDNFYSLKKKVLEWLNHKNLRAEWQEKRQRMLEDKIDVTAFWTWFIDQYPQSVDVCRKNQVHWQQFK